MMVDSWKNTERFIGIMFLFILCGSVGISLTIIGLVIWLLIKLIMIL
jgi:hypothetical protein